MLCVSSWARQGVDCRAMLLKINVVMVVDLHNSVRFCCMFSFRPQRYNFFLRYARNMPKKSSPHYFLIISSPFLCCLCYWIPLSSLSPKLSKWSLINHCLHCWSYIPLARNVLFCAQCVVDICCYCCCKYNSVCCLDSLDFLSPFGRTIVSWRLRHRMLLFVLLIIIVFIVSQVV